MLANERRRVTRRGPRMVGRGPVRVQPEGPASLRLARALEPEPRVLAGRGGPHQRRDREARRAGAPGDALNRSRRRRRAAAPHDTRRPRTARAVCDPCAASPDSIRPRARRIRSSWTPCAPRCSIAGPTKARPTSFGHCVLGHQRLKVIDLDTGYQPVANETGDVVAVFNGEAYNFRSLREELRGHEVRGTGDTPILPHLYEESGPRFVERLDGMFALALWDAGRERLVLARDRLGKKPLLWTRLPDGTLAFASELKALLRLPQVSREVDLERDRRIPGAAIRPRRPRPRCAGSTSSRPGTCSSQRAGRSGSSATGNQSPPNRARTKSEWLERVRATVGEAVRKRLVADVPLGALLSGGIDSEHRRRADGEAIVATRAHVHSRLPRRPLRRADVRTRGRVALRHGARGGARSRRTSLRRCRAWPQPSTSRSATRLRSRRF